MKLLVAVFACIILAAEARGPPPNGNKGTSPPPAGDNRGQGRPPRGLSAAKRFCQELNDGIIDNVNATFDEVFAAIEPVCDDLLDFMATNAPVRDPKPNRPAPTTPARTTPAPPSPAVIFRRTCDQVERTLDDERHLVELHEILVRFNEVCAVLDTI